MSTSANLRFRRCWRNWITPSCCRTSAARRWKRVLRWACRWRIISTAFSLDARLPTVSLESSSAADLIERAIRAKLAGWGTRPLVVGVCGSQGSGRSTVCKTLTAHFTQSGLRVANLSIDDLYLPLAERVKLAKNVHPLL